MMPKHRLAEDEMFQFATNIPHFPTRAEFVVKRGGDAIFRRKPSRGS